MKNLNQSCPSCDNMQVLFARPFDAVSAGYSVWFCRQCRFGQTLPVPDDDRLRVLHSTQYYRNGEGVRFVSPVEWLVEGMRWWRVHRLSRFIQNGRVLDVGCGSGRFLRAMQSSGWTVAGLELNDEVATIARSAHGLVVETTMNAFAEASFDLITITHVLEHVRDPQRMLADCARLLKPGGHIAVAVPNIESWQARLSRGKWFHLDLPRHLWHFSEKWLTKSLPVFGFEPIAVRRLDLAHNVFGWLQSLLNLSGLGHNRLYGFFRNHELENDGQSHYVCLLISFVLLPLLAPISLLLAISEAMFCAGGTVEVIARINNSK